MNRRTVLWIIPYFVAAILWLFIYKRPNSVVSLYFAGREHPLLFIVILGMFVHLVFGLLREWAYPAKKE